MKKDDISKVTSVKGRGPLRNDSKIQGAKSQSSKNFLGCDTCKLKHNVPVKTTKPVMNNQVKNQNQQGGQDNQNSQKMTIKLTDLCNEDKKRIVELMEELTRFAEKNKNLKESLDMSEKAKREQYECLMMQTNMHLEEKNLYLKQIQGYKEQLEMCEVEMKDKINKWELRERFLDNEIRRFAKALQKTINEKSELVKEINHLKACLKQSLESFELLSTEVATLQRLSVKSTKSSSSSRCMTGGGETKELPSQMDESEEEYMSVGRDHAIGKNSLDVINSKLEALYTLMQSKVSGKEGQAPDEERPPQQADGGGEKRESASGAPCEVEASKIQNGLNRSGTDREGGDTRTHEASYKFLKPFNEYNKTSIQAERILKCFERPLRFDRRRRVGSGKAEDALGEGVGTRETNDQREADGERDALPRSNNFEMLLDSQFNEDRLLSELFYSESVVDVGVEAAMLLAAREKCGQPHVSPKY